MEPPIGLHIELNQQKHAYNENYIISNLERDKTMEILVSKLPKNMGQLLQSVHFPQDYGELLRGI